MDSGPFDYPVTVIDTPGTNDPCLIRDEITRRSLETADLYIVVLTARQPLSAADVALLRILRGLHKERFVVFVNRIDELADIAANIRRSKNAPPISPIALEAVKRIDALFAVEREINSLLAATRLAARQEKSAPLVAAFEGWMRAERAKLSRHAAIAKAIDSHEASWVKPC